MSLRQGDTAVAAWWDDTELFRYIYLPSDPQLESPRPYFHPVRTLSGDLVSLYRPHDHVWHKGIALSLPNVGQENFWGRAADLGGRGRPDRIGSPTTPASGSSAAPRTPACARPRSSTRNTRWPPGWR